MTTDPTQDGAALVADLRLSHHDKAADLLESLLAQRAEDNQVPHLTIFAPDATPEDAQQIFEAAVTSAMEVSPPGVDVSAFGVLSQGLNPHAWVPEEFAEMDTSGEQFDRMWLEAEQQVFEVHPTPEIVCLCGSTRFYEAFQQANYDLTMAGKIVLSVGFYPHAAAEHGHGEGVGHDSEQKVALDELHKRKIDLADRVLVLNVGGYIGESTRSEIEYAIERHVPVDYLEPEEVQRA